jgi:septal ring factor EnvC (AmiA/AmiB activator)
MKIIKTITLLALSFSAISCNAGPLSYVELMRKPEVLHQEFANCQGVETARCDLVRQAAQEYEVLNTERQNNPELFGQRILLAQEEAAKLNAQLRQAQKDQQANDQNMRKMQANYAALNQKIAVMLAIVSATSPE